MENRAVIVLAALTVAVSVFGIMMYDFGTRIHSNTTAISDLNVDVVESIAELDKTLTAFMVRMGVPSQSVSFFNDPTKNLVHFKAEQNKNKLELPQ